MTDQKLHLFGDYVLDLTRGTLLRAGPPVHLRPQAYKTLKYLVENRGRLISKDQLIEEVWEGRAVTDDSLFQCLRDVRLALGDRGNQYLRNERGRGYIFDREPVSPSDLEDNTVWSEQIDLVRVVVDDEEAGGIASDGSEATSGSAITMYAAKFPRAHEVVKAKPNGGVGGWRRTAVLVSAVVLIASAAVAFSYFKSSRSRPQPITSIAVLPFVNEASDQNLEYLSDGLSESLINSLSQLPQLKVIARSSSFKYKGVATDHQKVAAALGVEPIMLGQLSQRGENPS